jgi:serine/threonine protein phosphatase 1
MPDAANLAVLRRARRVWAVPAIHGEAGRAAALLHRLAPWVEPDDRVVFLGNYLGYGAAVPATLDALLTFRSWLIAQPGMFAYDVVFLRGSQEEMWQKLLTLQFAVNPREVLAWMLDHGVGATITAYGGDLRQGDAATREGARAIARWTAGLRELMGRHPGHQALLSSLRHAAHTDDAGTGERGLLLVHAGIDPARPLAAQRDALWWGHPGFSQLSRPFEGFRLVIRGRDPAHGGIQSGPHAFTLDGGCGFGGPLVAACFDPGGRMISRIEA